MNEFQQAKSVREPSPLTEVTMKMAKRPFT